MHLIQPMGENIFSRRSMAVDGGGGGVQRSGRWKISDFHQHIWNDRAKKTFFILVKFRTPSAGQAQSSLRYGL